jgi:hypothetical protein
MPTSLGQPHRAEDDTRLQFELVCLWAAGGLVMFALLSDIGSGLRPAGEAGSAVECPAAAAGPLAHLGRSVLPRTACTKGRSVTRGRARRAPDSNTAQRFPVAGERSGVVRVHAKGVRLAPA